MALPSPDSSGLVGAGSPYPCSIGGRQYIIDLSDKNQFIEHTIPLLKNQFIGDTKNQLSSEASLNPEDLLRRGFESWHMGAGQTYFDRQQSDPSRFNTSSGVDPWTKWQLSLLNATRSIKALTTRVEDGVCSVGNYLYLADGNNVYFTSSNLASGAPTWTTVTGTPAAAVSSMCTDGTNVYASFYGGNGVYTSVAGAGSMSQLYTGTVGKVLYLKDRLFTMNGGGVLTNPTDFTAGPHALPSALLDKGNSFSWVCGAEGINHNYFGGFFADHSYIYKTAVKPDGTALDTPTIAGVLPDGETIRGMCGYLGYLLIGSSITNTGGTAVAGVRLAQIQSDGNLVLGPRLENGTALVYSFEPQDRFVWFGWTESSSESGLGRIDLSRFVDDLKPAMAKDVQYTGAGLGTVCGITTHLGRRVFRVDAQNLVVTDDSNLVATGDIYFGKVSYGLQDSKVGMFVDVDFTSTANSSVTVYVSVDGGARTSYGTLTSPGTVDLSALSGKEFEVSLRLTRDSVTTTTGPTVKKATLRSFINANRTREFIVPLIIRPRITTMTANEVYIPDTRAEIDALAAMVGTCVVWKYGTKTEYVQIKDYEWHPDYFDVNSGQFGGVCTVKMQVVHS